MRPKDDRGVAEVRALLAELLAQGRGAEALDQVVALLLQMVAQQDDLTPQLEAMRKLVYGRRSEKVSLAQPYLFMQEAGARPARSSQTTYRRRPSRHHRRRTSSRSGAPVAIRCPSTCRASAWNSRSTPTSVPARSAVGRSRSSATSARKS